MAHTHTRFVRDWLATLKVGEVCIGCSSAVGRSGCCSAVTSVTLAGIAASIQSENDTHVIVVVARGTDGVGDVVMTSNTGARTRSINGFTYLLRGAVDIVSPVVGQLNTVVTITGAGMLGGGSSATSVTLVNVAATVISASDTTITVIANDIAPGSEGRGDVVIISDTGSVVTYSRGFTYAPKGAISSVSPSVGVKLSTITISGTSLRGQGDIVTSVTLDGVQSSIVTETNSVVVVTAADAPEGAVAGDVVLTAETGATVTALSAFQYLTPADVTSVAPAFGQIATVVTIEGTTLFSGGTSLAQVFLDGTEVQSIVPGYNASYVEVVAARASASVTAGSVRLVSNIGTFNSFPGLFTYRAEGVISSVSPKRGRQGTRVTITGDRLNGGGSEVVAVTLGGNAVEQIVSESSVSVEVIAPAGVSVVGYTDLSDTVLTASSGAVVTLENSWVHRYRWREMEWPLVGWRVARMELLLRMRVIHI